MDGGRGGLVAFLGPSLPAAEARRLCPGVELLPPVCQGDLTSAVRNRRPRAVLMVDGEFSQALSVWHKEVLDAIERGVRVLGASSMGALRAAELDRFGMEGVGEIYAYYRDTWLTADSDVALVHGAAEDDWRPLTWPMVNVRATVAALLADGSVTGAEAEAVLSASERLHFSGRTRTFLGRELAGSGLPQERAEQLSALVEGGYVDQKARDATAGFELLARLDDVPAPARERPRHGQARGFDALTSGDVTVVRRAGTVRAYQVVDDAALHEPDFEDQLHRALDRNLVVQLATEHGVVPTDDELATERARLLRDLGLEPDDPAAVAEWLADSDLDEAGLDVLVRQQVLQRRMRRWLLDGHALAHNRRLVIEQLQLTGRYPAAADAAARRRRWADARPVPPQPATVQEVVELAGHQRAVSGWWPGRLLSDYADEVGFDSLGGLYVALADSRAAAEEQRLRRSRVAGALGLSPAPQPGPGARVQSLMEAHLASQVLMAAAELGLPEAIGDQGRDLTSLASAVGADPQRLARLLAALAALGMVQSVDDTWHLTDDGRVLGSLGAYAAYLRSDVLPAWSGLADVVRGSAVATPAASAAADAHVDEGGQAIGLFDAVVTALDLSGTERVADVGGGLGRTALALVQRHPGVRAIVVERPGTAERAAAWVAGRPSSERVTAVAELDELEDVDVCVLVRVLVTLDDDAATDLLGVARRALRTGGRIELFEPELDGGAPSALMDLLHLVRSGGGARTPDDWRRLAELAGLRVVRRAGFLPPFVHLSLEVAR